MANLGPQKMRALGQKVKHQEIDDSRLSANEGNRGPASKGSKNSKPSSKRGHGDVSAKGDDSDDYDDGDGFEDEAEGADDGEDPMERLRKAIQKENVKANKHKEEKKQLGKVKLAKQHVIPSSRLAGGLPGQKAGKNLEGFAMGKGLIVGERVDHAAANQQAVRAEELRGLIQLETEEFFNMFEIVPQTAQDVYF